MIKRFLIILLVGFNIFSCDKKATHEYYVQNHCEETIIVDILDYRNNFFSIEIAPSIEKVIYSGETINSVYENEITYFIKEIKIKKENIMLNKNLLDYRIWRFEEKTRFNGKSYLIVNPEDFENE
jgi:hypothetical protein